ncbi:YajG family lipoprotein [Motilimonas eburnea]|uniref:YajG family lipoprotein n=1 Tax=Motilimonas eburnea TaxID=1737488 RepID=UPI001E3F192F|nr:YajG family lipoprotein [Motilimonas eburnea]MCE2569931.1 YajG family lipoprotein [Motilimonas eburnea]
MKYLVAALFSLLLLSGCSSTQPIYLHLSPDLTVSDAQYPNTPSVALTSADLRTNKHIVSITEKSKPTQLINNDAPINDVLADKLGQALTQQGVSITSLATTKVHLEVIQLVTEVTQYRTKHTAKNTVELRLVVTTPARKVTKQYKNITSSEGSFSPSSADLEAALDKLLANVLNQMLVDKQVQQEIK